MTKKITWTKKSKPRLIEYRDSQQRECLEYLNQFSVTEITPNTVRKIQAYTFDECEAFIRSFFPNAVKREKGMFIFEYYVDDNYVGFVSMYTGTEFFAEISKFNKYEESELLSHE